MKRQINKRGAVLVGLVLLANGEVALANADATENRLSDWHDPVALFTATSATAAWTVSIWEGDHGLAYDGLGWSFEVNSGNLTGTWIKEK